ncbi:MAG: GHKL domain-containing protein [Gammaproteobacteria bacterium]|nr:GHKL domain-containing protein [Gammaproteobacteria bacterium]
MSSTNIAVSVAPLVITTVEGLAVNVPPISTIVKVEEVALLFLRPEYKLVLSIPVVEGRCAVGIISRHRFMEIYLRPYGRDLFGKKTVAHIMYSEALTVRHDESIDSAARHITENIEYPVKDDFIITKDGEYFGMAAVPSLLTALENQYRYNSLKLQKAYKQLKASQSQLIQSEKMASIGQMVAGVAHEINTPLGYVSNNVNMSRGIFLQVMQLVSKFEDLLHMMADENVDSTTLDQAILEIMQECEQQREEKLYAEINNLIDDSLYGLNQIGEIVTGLKDFSRIDKAAVANVSIHECIDNALMIGKNVIKNKANIHKKYADDIPLITCSPSKLNQVFLNLITNAAQAIEAFGDIYISTKNDGSHVIISIRDSGKGIPDSLLNKIFDPFFTTKKIGEGTGLGLSIVYQIIKQHRGLISVKSKVGHGTLFNIKLPIRQLQTNESMSPEILSNTLTAAPLELKKVMDF